MAWEILDGQLWQGSIVDAAFYPADIVITCSPESELPADLGGLLRDRLLHILFPFADAALLPDMDLARRIADLAAHQIALGRTVLAHCTAGRNRSGLMVGLILYGLGYAKGSAIVARIQERHPEALSNATFAAYLRTLT